MNEKAVSQAQQKFFGMVHAAQKDELKNPSKKVKGAAKNISKKEAKKYAETDTSDLPEKVEDDKTENESVDFSYDPVEELEVIAEELYVKRINTK